jgi:hypothetical protein
MFFLLPILITSRAALPMCKSSTRDMNI